MAISQHDPRHKLTKLRNYGHKIPRRFAQADKDDNKAHPLMTKLAMYSNICLPFYLFLAFLLRMTMVSLENLHKRPEALARYYVTSH